MPPKDLTTSKTSPDFFYELIKGLPILPDAGYFGMVAQGIIFPHAKDERSIEQYVRECGTKGVTPFTSVTFEYRREFVPKTANPEPFELVKHADEIALLQIIRLMQRQGLLHEARFDVTTDIPVDNLEQLLDKTHDWSNRGYVLASADLQFGRDIKYPDTTLNCGSFGAVLSTPRNYKNPQAEMLRKYFQRVVGHFGHAA